jgi:hypothetical protein
VRYWVAHARGCNFKRLSNLGFRHGFPTMDDYVFLKESAKNKRFLTKQTDLGIKFLSFERRLQFVTEAEVDNILNKVKPDFVSGSRVEVVSGFCSGLVGAVVEKVSSEYLVILQGYRLTYMQMIDPDDLAPEKSQETGFNCI